MDEIWKDVVGFESLYQISNYGKLRLKMDQAKFRAGYIFHERLDKHGYVEYRLTKDKKRYFKKAHRLVGEAFIPNPLNLATINHKNGIKTDNRVENLEWLSLRDNALHSLYELGNINKLKKGSSYKDRGISKTVVKKSTVKKKIDKNKFYKDESVGFPTRIRCIETGEIYNSITEAASHTNHHQGNISRALMTGWKAGGYHWERVE